MPLIRNLKEKLIEVFDVKLYELQNSKSFTGWSATQTPHPIFVWQAAYVKFLLTQASSKHFCSAQTLPSPDENIKPCHRHDALLFSYEHHRYWSLVGELAYLSVCTRLNVTWLDISPNSHSNRSWGGTFCGQTSLSIRIRQFSLNNIVSSWTPNCTLSNVSNNWNLLEWT